MPDTSTVFSICSKSRSQKRTNSVVLEIFFATAKLVAVPVCEECEQGEPLLMPMAT